MENYNITLYLAGGAAASFKQRAVTDSAAVQTIEHELVKPKGVFENREERTTLFVKNPEANVIAYSVDRVRP